jgi:cystathionine beta-lyase/cystathionine gamma-synthase
MSDRSAAWLREIGELTHRALADFPTVPALARLAEQKRIYADLVRTHQAVAASLITSSDWQSPSFLHAVRSMAGRYTGRITEHVDDYKRDRHGDAAAFEEAYLREYVDDHDRLGLRALMTSGGMSAFTTILGWLLLDHLVEGSVLIGRALYHECRELVVSAFGSRVREFDEADTAGTLRLIDASSPRAIFVDSLCNAKGIPVPDIEAMIGAIGALPHDVHLVVDNTGLSCGFQPYRVAPTHGPARPIVFESLTKYAQFGLDHVTAGMIVAPCEEAERLDAYREHLGTNVADTSVYLVPWPDRTLLKRRLARLERNASILASRLAAHHRLGGPVFRGIAYPGLPGDRSFDVASCLPFRGGFFEIEFADGARPRRGPSAVRPRSASDRLAGRHTAHGGRQLRAQHDPHLQHGFERGSRASVRPDLGRNRASPGGGDRRRRLR